MANLSVVISAYNAEKTIENCLKSASFAEEIIFIDNGSSDDTAKIAKKYTSKIFNRQNNLMLNVNKNFGFSKTLGDWILSLDSDEIITKELESEIRKALNKESNISGYYIPRKNIIFGKWMEHTGWYPDNQLRLFRKGKGIFPQKHVHEALKIDGEVGYLKEHMVHNHYRSIYEFITKFINIYAPNEAEQILKNGYVFNHLDAIKFPVKEFLSRFFAREGYKDGFHGLMLSILMGFYHLVVFAVVWEKLGFKKVEDRNILLDTEKEIKKSHSEFIYWFSNEKIKSSKSFVKKSLLKLQRKLS